MLAEGEWQASREECSRAVTGVLGVEAWRRGLISGLPSMPFPSRFALVCPDEWVGSGGGRSGAVSTRGGGCPLRGADAVLTDLGAGQVYRAH